MRLVLIKKKRKKEKWYHLDLIETCKIKLKKKLFISFKTSVI